MTAATVTIARKALANVGEALLELDTVLNRVRRLEKVFGDVSDAVELKALCDYGHRAAIDAFQIVEPLIAEDDTAEQSAAVGIAPRSA